MTLVVLGVATALLALAALRSPHTKTAAAGWAFFILALCSIPGPSLPPLAILTFDKVGHFGMFFIGAFLWMRAWPRSTARVLAAGLAFSALTEIYQGLVVFIGRSPDPFDFVADALGLIVGLALWWWWHHRPVPAA